MLLNPDRAAGINERIRQAEALHADFAAILAAAPAIVESLPYVWACSDFVATWCTRNIDSFLEFVAADGLRKPQDAAKLRLELNSRIGNCADDAELFGELRKFRNRELVRIAWRDIAGWAELGETLTDLSQLADICIECSYARAFDEMQQRYGSPCGADSGLPQSLVVLGMGKLGGRELNFSSDIDLIFLYPEDGETRATRGNERTVDNAEFFLRVGQRLIALLANKTVDGFVYRVDMRLRPFGDSGRMAISFDSFEDYLQQHGRDWERYAYVKARPVVGVEHYEMLYRDVVRPFVYRRYLDFGVFDSLRDMKARIDREVTRRELQDNIKLGPGGIREIEFIAQALQLIRGGTDRRLQARELERVLPLLVGQKLLPQNAVDDLWRCYAFLRRLENRLQEWNDEQTHRLPQTDADRSRLALAMGAPSWTDLDSQIEACREVVAMHFSNVVFGPTDSEESPHAADSLDIGMTTAGLPKQFAELRDSSYYRKLDENGRRRLHILLYRVLRILSSAVDLDTTLTRFVRIIEMIGGRTIYLALLNESDIALRRLLELCAKSKFLADQIATSPLLLDELIDAQIFESIPTRSQFRTELDVRIETVRNEDEGAQIEALRQFQQAAMFRIAVADFSGKLPLMKISDLLTDLAELIVDEALAMAWAHITARHGVPRCGPNESSLRDAKVIVVAYGKFGGVELGYGSDLDLVFLHDSAGEVQATIGPQPVDNSVFFARIGQRLVHLLTTYTRAGALYEVDIRLRPSGKGGLLVQSLDAFEQYQRSEAWTWEHQALLRARAVAGEREVCRRFEDIRIAVLRKAVRRDTLREEVRQMRQRMRSELSKAKQGQFDLKQDAGGIADLEFLTQYWMLKWCDEYPPIITFSDNIRQLESLASGAIVAQDTVDFLTTTYRKYRQRMHHLSLDGGDDVIADTEFIDERNRLKELWISELGN